MTEKQIRELNEFNATIQICPNCGKVDAYKDDGHTCNAEFWRRKQIENNEDYKLAE